MEPEKDDKKELKISEKLHYGNYKKLKDEFCYSCGDFYTKYDLFTVFTKMTANTYLETLKIPVHEKCCKKCLFKLTTFWRLE